MESCILVYRCGWGVSGENVIGTSCALSANSEETMTELIFIVDDDFDSTTIIGAYLAKQGYTVEGFEKPVEALEAALQREVALVLLDVMMPEMDGWTLCRRLRTTKKNTRVVMMTVLGGMENQQLALTEGANDYIQKPYSLVRVGEVVERNLKIWRKQSGGAPEPRDERKHPRWTGSRRS